VVGKNSRTELVRRSTAVAGSTLMPRDIAGQCTLLRCRARNHTSGSVAMRVLQPAAIGAARSLRTQSHAANTSPPLLRRARSHVVRHVGARDGSGGPTCLFVETARRAFAAAESQISIARDRAARPRP